MMVLVKYLFYCCNIVFYYNNIRKIMGSLFQKTYSNPYQQFFNGKKLRAIMVGLDAAGKTTIIYKMSLRDLIPTLPLRSGFETVEFQKVKITSWDL